MNLHGGIQNPVSYRVRRSPSVAGGHRWRRGRSLVSSRCSRYSAAFSSASFFGTATILRSKSLKRECSALSGGRRRHKGPCSASGALGRRSPRRIPRNPVHGRSPGHRVDAALLQPLRQGHLIGGEPAERTHPRRVAPVRHDSVMLRGPAIDAGSVQMNLLELFRQSGGRVRGRGLQARAASDGDVRRAAVPWRAAQRDGQPPAPIRRCRLP